jgi:hypothetical protein
VTAIQLAAIVYALATSVVVGFQLALAAGAPWGEYAMGGRFAGRFPPSMRAAAVVQAVILGSLALVVLDAAGLVELGWAAALPWLVWVPVVVSALSAFLNAITPSRAERRLWLPLGLVLLVSSTAVALAPG